MDLSAIPPEQLARIPAGEPPLGVIPNLVNPSSIGYVFYIGGAIGMVFMFVFAGLRYYTKFFLWRRTTSDDWTTLAAIVVTILYFIAGVFGVVKGKHGTHIWDMSLQHFTSNELIITGFFTNWPSMVGRMLAKTSFFLMYIDMFRPFKWLRYMCWGGLVVNTLFYVCTLSIQLAFTAPAPGQSWKESYMSKRFAKTFGTVVPFTTGGLIIDIYIFILPILALQKLQMTTRKKIGVGFAFATGSIACVASALTVYYGVKMQGVKADFTYYVLPVILMALIEMCTGIACSCMPTCAHFFRRKSRASRSSAAATDQSTRGARTRTTDTSTSTNSFASKLHKPFASMWTTKASSRDDESYPLSSSSNKSELTTTSTVDKVWEGHGRSYTRIDSNHDLSPRHNDGIGRSIRTSVREAENTTPDVDEQGRVSLV